MNFALNLNKRQKIVLSSIILTMGLLSTQLVDFNLRFRFLGGLAVLAYILSFWSLKEGLNITKAVVLLILPTFFTVAVASFYFLLPIRWLTRLPVAFIFGLTFYLLLLAQNVFNVASIRTIPLYRAASTVSFLFSLISLLFIYNVVYSLNLLFIWNGLIVSAISFPLILQVLWSIKMEERITLVVLVQSFVLSLVVGEFALVLSFWPLINVVWSMSVATSLYVLLGLTVDHIHGRLKTISLADYLFIGFFIFTIAYFLSSWAGEEGITILRLIGLSVALIAVYFLLVRNNINDRIITNKPIMT